MTPEQTAELRTKLKHRSAEYLQGYAAAIAALSQQLDEDRRTIDPPAHNQRTLHEYLDVLSRELRTDAEGLRE
jgi:hypothetical protein